MVLSAATVTKDLLARREKRVNLDCQAKTGMMDTTATMVIQGNRDLWVHRVPSDPKGNKELTAIKAIPAHRAKPDHPDILAKKATLARK